MAQVKVSELSGGALDWAVAKCEGLEVVEYVHKTLYVNKYDSLTGEFECQYGFKASVYWNQGGPIIMQQRIAFPFNDSNGVKAKKYEFDGFGRISYGEGETLLIAAMRCYVASKLGDTIEIPDELQREQWWIK